MESLISNNALNYDCDINFHDVSHIASKFLSLDTEKMQSKIILMYASG